MKDKYWPIAWTSTPKAQASSRFRGYALLGNSFDFNSLKSPLLGFWVIQTGFSPVLVTSDEALQLGKIFSLLKMFIMKKLTDFRKTVDLRLAYISLLAVISNSSNLLG